MENKKDITTVDLLSVKSVIFDLILLQGTRQIQESIYFPNVFVRNINKFFLVFCFINRFYEKSISDHHPYLIRSNHSSGRKKN